MNLKTFDKENTLAKHFALPLLIASISLFSGLFASAAEPAWVPVTTELLQREKTGYGGLCGVVVDHVTGDLWVNLSDLGMFYSSDQGQTWKRVSNTQPTGRTETPGCWLLDPTGKTKHMATALVYGHPISFSDDGAAVWKSLDNKSSHIRNYNAPSTAVKIFKPAANSVP